MAWSYSPRLRRKSPRALAAVILFASTARFGGVDEAGRATGGDVGGGRAPPWPASGDEAAGLEVVVPAVGLEVAVSAGGLEEGAAPLAPFGGWPPDESGIAAPEEPRSPAPEGVGD